MTSASYIELLGDRYELQRELGRGGSATVWLARDRVSGSEVAVKVLHEELIHAKALDRFEREIELMRQLDHPHILKILDSGRWGERLYCVMPYVDGVTLRTHLEQVKGRMLQVEDVTRLGVTLCEALAYAHDRGFVHRDVKPENILLSRDRIYLTDFGIARALDPEVWRTLTSYEVALGTPAYMSPEQALAEREIDGRSDLYSLGLVLYEALAGVPAFAGPNAAAVISMRLSGNPRPLHEFGRRIPDGLIAAVTRATSRLAVDRWPNAREMRATILAGAHTPAAAHAETRLANEQNTAESDAGFLADITKRRAAYATAAVVLAIGLALVRGQFGGATQRNGEVAAVREHNVIAVSFSADPTQTIAGHVAQQLAAQVIAELAHVPAFRVLPSTMMRTCDQGSVSECNAMLASEHVGSRLTGTVQAIRDSLLILVQVSDEAKRTTLMTFSQTIAGLVDVGGVNALAERISAGLRRRLGAVGRLSDRDLASLSPEARTLLSAAARQRADAESLAAQPGLGEQRSAVALLLRADSMIAAATRREHGATRLWVERGWIALEASRGQAEERQQTLKLGLAYAESALVRKPGDADALELRGFLRWTLSEPTEIAARESERLLCEAEADFRQAVTADPSLFRSWSALSELLWMRGKTQEARLAVAHAMESDAYMAGAQESFENVFFAQLFLANYADARRVCAQGRELWPTNFKFWECELTLMLYDASARQDVRRARELAQRMDELDSREKAKLMRNEYRAIYRQVVVGIVAARSGERNMARRVLDWALAQVAGDTTASGLRYDLSPQEATLRWELGEKAAARDILVDWLRHQPEEFPNFTRDPTWRRMKLTDAVVTALGSTLPVALACAQ